MPDSPYEKAKLDYLGYETLREKLAERFHSSEEFLELLNPGLFLRPGMFAGNALGWWAPQIRAGDIVRWPHLAAPTAPIDERDIAAVAVRALCEDGHAGAK